MTVIEPLLMLLSALGTLGVAMGYRWLAWLVLVPFAMIGLTLLQQPSRMAVVLWVLGALGLVLGLVSDHPVVLGMRALALLPALAYDGLLVGGLAAEARRAWGKRRR
jgi:hypothetical protein